MRTQEDLQTALTANNRSALRKEITLLEAHEIAGLITYSYGVWFWLREDMGVNGFVEVESLEEAKKIGRKLGHRGYFGKVDSLVRKKSGDFMAYHFSKQVWSF